jgi:hypothetical protein
MSGNFGPSSFSGDDNVHHTSHLLCRYHGGPGERRITALEVEGCPSRRKNCVECEHLEEIVIPSGPNPIKSHECVVCRLVIG